MKILSLTTSFPRNKKDHSGIFVLKLLETLSQKNDVTVVAPNFPEGKENEKFGKLKVKRFNYFFPKRFQKVIYPNEILTQLRISFFAKIGLPFFLLFFILKTIKESKNSEIVLCNWVFAGFIALIAGIITRKKYVVVLRGSDMKTIERGGLMSKIFSLVLKKSKAVCAVSKDITNTLKKYGVDCNFTPNGLEHSKFNLNKKSSRKKLGLKDEIIVLYVGSFIKRKDVSTLLKAMEGVGAKLYLVGEGDEKEALEREATNLGLDVVFVGSKNPKEIKFWYGASDIFVLSSLYEGRPNVLMEAMASGNACIASNIKGSKELIDDGKSGYLFKKKDSKQLNKKINTLVKNKKLREKFGKNAKKNIKQIVPTWKDSAKNYETIISEILMGAP